MTITEYYKYAMLATAAYVRMGSKGLDGAAFAAQASSDAQQRLPVAQGQYLFAPTEQLPNPSPWTVLSYYGGDASQGAADMSGFGATLFERSGEKVLALRGTEPSEEGFLGLPGTGVDLLSADLAQQIGILGLALTQADKLKDYYTPLMDGS